MVDRINNGKPTGELENLREKVRWLTILLFMLAVTSSVVFLFLKKEADKYTILEIKEAMKGLSIEEETIN